MGWDTVDGWVEELDANPALKQAVEGPVPQSVEDIARSDSWSTIFEGYLEPKFEAGPRFRCFRAIQAGEAPDEIYARFVDYGGEDLELSSDVRDAYRQRRDAVDNEGNPIPWAGEDFVQLRDYVNAWLTQQWLEPFQRRIADVQEALIPAPLIPDCWLHEDLLKGLKGNPRPDTFAEIEKGGFWWDVFDDWATKCPEGSGWRDKWEQFKANPSDRRLREELKPLVKSKDAPFNYSVGLLKDKLS